LPALWKKTRLVLVYFILNITFVATFLLPSVIWGQQLPELLKDINPDIVAIYSYDSLENYIGEGSGFFLNNNTLITCYHVIEDAFIIKFNTAEDNTYFIDSIVSVDFDGDLAKLHVDAFFEIHKGLNIAHKYPLQGERVIVVGNPLGLKRSISDGLVSAIREIPEFGKIIQITAPISPGSSGSPVINLNGEVVGIASVMMLDGQNVNFAIPFERILCIDSLYNVQMDDYLTNDENEFIVEDYYNEIQRLMDYHIYDSALYFWSILNEYYEDDSYIYFNIGYCNYMMERYEDAIGYFNKSNLVEKSLDTYYNIGLSYQMIGDTINAISAFENALKMDANDSTCLYELGLLYYYNLNFHKAREYLNHYLSSYSEDEYLRSLLCDCYYLTEEFSLAETCYRNYFQINTDDSYSYERYGLVLMNLNKYGDAINCFNKCIYSNWNRPYCYAYVAECYTNQANITDAKSYYEKALSLITDEAFLYNNYGALLQRMGKPELALENYKKAISLDPNEWLYFWNIANIYSILGYKDEANKAFKRAQELRK